MSKTLLPVILVIILLSGCLDNECVDMQFERLSETDKIVISNNMNKEIRSINDRATISQIVNFTLSHKTTWATPLAGTPVALLRANFYSNGKFIGDLGVGSNFLTAQGCGYFQSRSVSDNDRKIIMGLFSVDDPYHKQ
jgi:hypothetical protein